MSQRIVAAAGAPSAGDSAAQGPPAVQQYAEVNPLMPASLRTVPPWYEGSNFRHTGRLLLGALPGAILLITVTGTRMLTAILGGALLTLMIRYLGHRWLSMMSVVGHVVVLEVVNVYCMAPLVWRSVLNLPLYGIFHFFIAITGIFWWLHEEEFRKQEPRFVIMLERICFYLYPAISVTMVTWISGILFGRAVLPFVSLLAGVAAFSLYLVPLQSSFAKPSTPAGVALIQHRFVVWLYTVLLMTVPPISFAALMPHYTLYSFMLLALIVVSPLFLLTLLEAQGLGDWYGVTPWMVQSFRMLSGVIVLVLVSACVSLAQPASILPLLLLPILLLTMALISFADHAPSTRSTLVVGGVLALLYIAAFSDLPWFISHTSSFLQLPLPVLQLLVGVVALGGVGVMTFWSKVTPQVLAGYNGVFVLCEYILTWDQVYPLSVAMTTGLVAVFTFWRLHTVGKLPLTTCLLSMCVHVTKLSLLFPCAHSPSPLTSSLLPFCSTFITSYLVLRLFLFDHASSLGSGQLLAYSGLLFVGLLLSVDTILSPIWASLTHSLPTSASLLATVLGAVALYINYGVSLMGPRDSPPVVSSLPPSLGVLAVLLWVLQPEFSVPELVGSLVVTVGDKAAYPEFIYVAAWKNLLTWVTLFSTVFALLQVISPSRVEALTVASASLLGVLAGFLAALSVMQQTPGTVGSLLYAAMLGVGGALCGRAHSARNQGSWIDKILFFLLFLLFLATYCVEFISLPHHYIPGRPRLNDYGKPCALIIAACSLVVAVVFRVKMYVRKEEPFLPIQANLACCVFFVSAILQQFHPQAEIAILLSSLVFLLTQPDGALRPKRNYLFVAPCLMWAIFFLYIVAITSVLPFFSQPQRMQSLFAAGRIAEVMFLLMAVPGHLFFLYSLWTGHNPTISVKFMFLYVVPHCLLPQLASSLATSILGSVGIFSFSLILVTSYTQPKEVS